MKPEDSDDYLARKAFFDRVLTVYGRKATLEVMRDGSLPCHALHLADSNRETGIVAQLLDLARQRNIPVKRHNRAELARISRNGKQDQGVAADIVCPKFSSLDSYLDHLPTRPQQLLALDGITNPQNLGMILRSAAAGHIDGVLWSRRGNAALGPLVIKASAGTIYRAPIIRCENLPQALQACARRGFSVCSLSAVATDSLFDYGATASTVYVLGNESEGVSAAVAQLCDRQLSIPMRNGVESLNVAVAASLIAFLPGLQQAQRDR